MLLSYKVIKVCLIYQIVVLVSCDNNLSTTTTLTADDFEKRRSAVKDFFDSLVAGTQNSKHSSQSSIQSTPRPHTHSGGPIYMPFAVPVHSPPPPPPSPPHVHMAPPPFAFPSNINSIFRSPPPSSPHRHVHHMGPPQYSGPPHHHHDHQHDGPHSHSHSHSHGPPPRMPYPPQSHHYPIPHYHDFPMAAPSRPIAIAIPLPLHAIPLHLIPHNGIGGIGSIGGIGDIGDDPKTSDFGDTSANTKFALFADPFEDMMSDNLYDSPQGPPRYKFIPLQNIPKNELIK